MGRDSLGIVIVALVFAVVLLGCLGIGGFLALWSLNVLFDLALPYDLKHIVAASILCCIVNAGQHTANTSVQSYCANKVKKS